MLQPLLSNWASPGRASPHVEGDTFPLLTSPLSWLGVVLSPRPTAAHLCLWRRGRRSPPILGSRAASPPPRGNGPSPASAGYRSSSAGPQGRVSLRGPHAEPRRVSPLSPAAISPGFASPRDPRPIPDPGGVHQRLPTASLHRAQGKLDGADGAHVRSAMLVGPASA
ncbi:hypothetical protein NDU88_002186 [Pleurodeles waltl]|uniref:Uncharacterized protein n=1 Tax=Pleurodeles waltl TaxID=8319 RepID=A0AAV7UCF6_PLEWA|nr:hypothetical protein NDU88_002186 [Pleurodeles waltl]